MCPPGERALMLIGARALVPIGACGRVRVRICLRSSGARLVLEPWCPLVPRYRFGVDAGIIFSTRLGRPSWLGRDSRAALP